MHLHHAFSFKIPLLHKLFLCMLILSSHKHYAQSGTAVAEHLHHRATLSWVGHENHLSYSKCCTLKLKYLATLCV